MNDVQLVVIVGPLVSLVFQWLKSRWAWLDCTDATVKQVTVCLVAGLAVMSANGWQLTRENLAVAVGAALGALVTHKTLLQEPAKPVVVPTKAKSPK